MGNEKKERKKRSPEEIEADKAKMREELKDQSIHTLVDSATTPTEREFGRKCRTLYSAVRKGLILIEKKRFSDLFTNQEAYEKQQELLKLFCDNDVDQDDDEEY